MAQYPREVEVEASLANLAATLEADDPARLDRATAYLVDRIKDILSVQAPRRMTRSGRWVATTPATPGAPPRMVSGFLHASVVRFWVTPKIVRIGVFAPYGRPLEEGNHPFFQAVMDREAGVVGRMLAGGQ